jgi:hypothetical protein
MGTNARQSWQHEAHELQHHTRRPAARNGRAPPRWFATVNTEVQIFSISRSTRSARTRPQSLRRQRQLGRPRHCGKSRSSPDHSGGGRSFRCSPPLPAIRSPCRWAPTDNGRENRMAGFLFRLETVDGTTADPPTLESAVPNWRSGDSIHLGIKTLHGRGQACAGAGRRPGPGRGGRLASRA